MENTILKSRRNTHVEGFVAPAENLYKIKTKKTQQLPNRQRWFYQYRTLCNTKHAVGNRFLIRKSYTKLHQWYNKEMKKIDFFFFFTLTLQTSSTYCTNILNDLWKKNCSPRRNIKEDISLRNLQDNIKYRLNGFFFCCFEWIVETEDENREPHCNRIGFNFFFKVLLVLHLFLS